MVILNAIIHSKLNPCCDHLANVGLLPGQSTPASKSNNKVSHLRLPFFYSLNVSWYTLNACTHPAWKLGIMVLKST